MLQKGEAAYPADWSPVCSADGILEALENLKTN